MLAHHWMVSDLSDATLASITLLMRQGLRDAVAAAGPAADAPLW
jgi:hypothetical protein